MNSKENYKKAVRSLADILSEVRSDGGAHPKRHLDDIHRYCGELRRKVTLLSDEVAQLQGVVKRLESLPCKVEQLERTKSELENSKKLLSSQKDQLERRVQEVESLIQVNGRYSDVEDHTQIKVKCLECALHFTIFSWYPDRHNCGSIHCPECGQHDGQYLIWHEDGNGFIFQNVPGDAVPVEFNQRMLKKQSELPSEHIHKPSNN